ncbi:phosphodiester glycosidase family protein [Clostridium frigidicarnis]|uniref:Exopolysaccharide biosynthesis protein n=1 Tax=Clostridium frigidicarnis TaxID=84698 RepID=A0A1I0ZB06_9CLOT|nr:phosphodiester glycosidase family protein [Clostridium frigidicarnis]SFB22582.1 Exopolysaccharide biosynthesis protein [Clostridium frigidicarnis]
MNNEKNNSTQNKRKKRSKKKNKKSWKTVMKFLVFQILFIGITSPFLIFYGPFENVRDTIVGAAMTTLNHKYIATLFLSNEKINEILSSHKVEDIEQDNKNSDIKLPISHDDTIERYNVSSPGKFKGYMLVIKEPRRLMVGYTEKFGVEGQLTSQIARSNDAVAAINGGGFPDESTGWTGTGATPTGVIIHNGEIKFDAIKNEETKVDTMAFTKEGRLLVGKYNIKELKELKVTEALSFGPPLVVNGKPTITSGDGGWGVAPRTAIGQRRDGAIVMLVIDGRQVSSLGATLREVQDLLIEKGVVNATNLDGGSSSTMYLNGEVINNPANSLGERAVPSVVYVK